MFTISKKCKSFLIYTILVILLTSVFSLNLLNRNDDGFFKNFQLDSQLLITGKIQADAAGLDTNNYGYGLYDEEHNAFSNSTSLVGLQGFFYSFFYNIIGIKSFFALNLLSCFLLAIVTVAITILLKKQYDTMFAIVYFAVILLSPWTVAMAKNLFWVEFLLFLPAIFTLLMIKTDNNKKMYLYLFCLFLAAFAKSLCGYEFLTTVLIFAISFPIIEFFMAKNKVQRIKMFKIVLFSGIVFLLGFVCALLWHASLRGDTVFDGLNSIWQQDVLRRTFGANVDNFDTVLSQSILASPIEVIYMYVYGFITPIILGISGQLFMLLSFLTFCVLIYFTNKTKNIFSFENVAFVMFTVTAISWLIFGKSHSFIHTHINFIVFYFGYVQICAYILLKFLFFETNNIKKLFKDNIVK